MRTHSAPALHPVAARALRTAGWLGLAGIVLVAASPIPAGETGHLVPQAAFLVAVFATGALVGRWSAAVRLLTAAAILGWVAWRPEALSDWNFAIPPARVAEGAMLALACDRLLAIAAGLGATPARRRAVRVAGGLAVATLVVLAVKGARSPYDPGYPCSGDQGRYWLTREVCGRLTWNSAATEYYFGSVPDLLARHRPHLTTALYECKSDGPCLPYYRILRDMLAELNDGHSGVFILGETTWPRVRIEPVGGAPVITDWIASPELGTAGLRRGLTVETVDGRPVREFLENRPPWLVAESSPHERVQSAHRFLLAGPPGSEVRLGARDPGGRAREIVLRRPVQADTVGGGAVPDTVRLAREDAAEDDAVDLVSPGRGGDPPVIRIAGFQGRTLYRRFVRALRSLEPGAGLVVDIRGNPGGASGNALAVAGHFFRQAWKAGEEIHFDRTKPPNRDDRTSEDTVVAPRLPIHDGPVALLIDHDTASAGDLLAYVLCRSGRARCFGRTTAGELHSVNRWWVDGVHVGLADSTFRPSLPGRLHGFGVVPHEPVERTLRDVVSGRDADLDAATRWLATQRGRTDLAWRTDLPRPRLEPATGPRGRRPQGGGDRS
jgi:C-terminal processing protease CtpA/Prc